MRWLDILREKEGPGRGGGLRRNAFRRTGQREKGRGRRERGREERREKGKERVGGVGKERGAAQLETPIYENRGQTVC